MLNLTICNLYDHALNDVAEENMIQFDLNWNQEILLRSPLMETQWKTLQIRLIFHTIYYPPLNIAIWNVQNRIWKSVAFLSFVLKRNASFSFMYKSLQWVLLQKSLKYYNLSFQRHLMSKRTHTFSYSSRKERHFMNSVVWKLVCEGSNL